MEWYIKEIKRCFLELRDRETFYKQIPNLLTLSRIVMVIPIDILLLKGNLLWGLILSLGVFITDLLDGKLARKFNCTSEFGGLLDAVSDKLMVMGLIIPLLGNNLILVVNLLYELLISLVNVKSKLKGFNTGSNMAGKVKTWGLFITLGMGILKLIFPKIIDLTVIFGSITVGLQNIALVKYIDSYIKNKKNSDVDRIKNNDILVINEDKMEKGDKVVRESNREFKVALREDYPEIMVLNRGKRRIRKIDNI